MDLCPVALTKSREEFTSKVASIEQRFCANACRFALISDCARTEGKCVNEVFQTARVPQRAR